MASERPKESVWDYPRPPRVEPEARRVRVELGGETVADSTRSLRVLETASPPTVYVPSEDVRAELLSPAEGGRTLCEWKGRAHYLHAEAGGAQAERAAWHYPEPRPGFERLAGHIAFYAGRVDTCYLDDEVVTPAGRELLRRLGDGGDRGALQGRAGHRGLVRPPDLDSGR